ncbi:hypothetical protein [Paenibacillus kobensis]|uniref:hypothetical protein n=1 Tax=Paenibacillus kobensis TaxID=59841 RepID=UPI000FDC4A0E|nr:hypothetical protein [Paenibacillus kobensis]
MAKVTLTSPAKGVLMGVSATGGWLLADLLLPEPWGDFVLFGAMAVVNIGIGWKLGKLFEIQNDKEPVDSFDTKNATHSDIRS